jgi:hypothetical protein
VTYKIRSASGPLIMGRRDGAENAVKWRELERFLVEEFWRTSSEKGYRRKYTENRVTRWRFLYWGNLAILR